MTIPQKWLPFKKEFYAWSGMKRRCYEIQNRFYHRYGARGITVCDQWKSNFIQFLADVGPAPTAKHCLDRIDNDGNYEPSNVKWSTQKEQANNRSGIHLKKITFNGMTKNLTEWNIHLGFSLDTVNARLKKHGWSIEDALTLPKYARGKKKNHII